MRLRSSVLLLCAAGLTVVAKAQLIAYLPFDGSAADASDNHFAVTVSNATYTPNGYSGGAGGAYYFDGTSSYLELPTLDINPSVYPQLTMGAWVLATDVTPIRQIISQDDGALDRSLGLDARSGTNGWSAFTGNGWLGSESASTGVWTFVAVVYDQTAGTATLYVNGNTYTATGVTSGSGWTFTRIGMNPSYGEYFSGVIDEVFFVSSALSTTQLDAIRLNGVMAGLSAVPEPGTWMLLATGLGLLALATRRRPR